MPHTQNHIIIKYIERHYICVCVCVCVCVCTQLCPTLCDPMDCNLPDSSVHGIFQARLLEWVAISSPGDFPNSGIKPMSPILAGRFFTTEPPGKPIRNTFAAQIWFFCAYNFTIFSPLAKIQLKHFTFP